VKLVATRAILEKYLQFVSLERKPPKGVFGC